jgi:S-DNA-T family DNA segregation ATPase FtsK/SpoIIIE
MSMHTLRRHETPLERLTDAARDVLRRRLKELVGLALIAVPAALAIALATWSVNDPSLNHATATPVRNWLGSPGAIASDLAIQLLGLGAIAALLSPAAWGLAFLKRGTISRPFIRVILWLVGVGAAAATASALPPTGRWPLPTGLGGVTGDAVLGAGRSLLLQSGATGDALAGLAFAALAILALSASCGFRRDRATAEEETAPAPSRKRDERDETPRDEEPSWAIVTLGAMAHGVMSLKAAFVRRREARDAVRSEPQLERMERRPARDLVERSRIEPLVARPERLPEPSPRAAPRVAPPPPPFDDEDEDEMPVLPPPSRIAPARDAPLRGPARQRTIEAPPPPADFDEDEDEAGFEPETMPVGRSTARAGEPVAQRTPPAQSTLRVSAPAPSPVAARQSPASPPRGAMETYTLPELALLAEPKKQIATVSKDALEQNATLLESTLEDFGVRGEIINVRPGPVVTLYELEPAPGTKSSRVIGLADDIARSMSAVSARVAVVPGRNVIGIELPNQKRETVFLRELLASADFVDTKQKLALCLGKNIGGEPIIADLARMPHLLVAGTTGSGKSVAINTMILSLLYMHKPEQCRLIMVDPKMLELSVYDGIPHLLTPVVTDPKKAVIALKWAVREMEERYKKMSKVGVRNIDGFNERVAEASSKGEVITRTVQTGFDKHTGEAVYEDEVMDLEPLPFIVIIVDEMADLMMVAGKDIEGAIQRLAQMARAAGIHVVLATQRPSVDVITGTIKANFPTRISFQVTSKIDSRTILGEMGAEQLLGQGDMLYMAGGGRITRVHGPFVSDLEVEKVVAHLKAQGRPQYLDAVTSGDDDAAAAADDGPVFDKGAVGAAFGDESADPYDQAIAVVMRDKKLRPPISSGD